MYGLTNTVPSSSRPLLRIAFGAPLIGSISLFRLAFHSEGSNGRNWIGP
jgi:hypothetical protein